MTMRVREALDEWVDAELGERFALGEPLAVTPGVRRYRVQDVASGDAAVTLTVFSRAALRARGLDELAAQLLAVARAAPHPSVQSLLGVGATDRLRWCTYEETAARTLSEWNALRRPRSADEALDVAGRIAAAVDAVHARGVAHGALELNAVRRHGDGTLILRPTGVDCLVAALADPTVEPASPVTDRRALARLLHAMLLAREETACGDDSTATETRLLAFVRKAVATDTAAPATGLGAFIEEARAVAHASVSAQPGDAPRSRARDGARRADASPPSGRPPSGAQPLLMVGPPLGAMRGPVLAAAALLAGLVALPFVRTGGIPLETWGSVIDVRDEAVSLSPLARPANASTDVADAWPAETAFRVAPDTTVHAVSPPGAPPAPQRVRMSVPDRGPRPSNTRPTVAEPPPAAATSPPVIAEIPRARTYGLLSVSARPWAHVYVDDSLVGHTPLSEFSIESGHRRIRLVRPGFRAHIATADVRAGETVSLLDVVLRPEVP